MIFHSPGEVFRAHAEGKLGLHARIQVRFPAEKKVISEVKQRARSMIVEEIPRKTNGLSARPSAG